MAEIVAGCTVYGIGERLIMQTRGWDEEDWAWMGILTIDVRDAGESPAELGQALLDAVAASGPVPPDAKGGASGRLLFEVAGVESHVELGRLAKVVEVVEEDDGNVMLIPLVPSRRPGSWGSDVDGTRVSRPTAEEAGRALIEALAQSPTWDEAHGRRR